MIASDFLLRALQDEREREHHRRIRRLSDVPSGPRHARTELEPRRIQLQLRPTTAICTDAS